MRCGARCEPSLRRQCDPSLWLGCAVGSIMRGASDQLPSHRQGALGALQTSFRVKDIVPCVGRFRPASQSQTCAGRFRPSSESQTGCPVWGASDQLPSYRYVRGASDQLPSHRQGALCGALQTSFPVTDRVPCAGRFRPASESQTGCPVWGASDQRPSHRHGALFRV